MRYLGAWEHLGHKDVLGLNVPVQYVETMDVLNRQDNLESFQLNPLEGFEAT